MVIDKFYDGKGVYSTSSAYIFCFLLYFKILKKKKLGECHFLHSPILQPARVSADFDNRFDIKIEHLNLSNGLDLLLLLLFRRAGSHRWYKSWDQGFQAMARLAREMSLSMYEWGCVNLNLQCVEREWENERAQKTLMCVLS